MGRTKVNLPVEYMGDVLLARGELHWPLIKSISELNHSEELVLLAWCSEHNSR